MSTSWGLALGARERGTVTAPFFQRRKRTGQSLVLNPWQVRGDRVCLLTLKFLPSSGNIVSFIRSFIHTGTFISLTLSAGQTAGGPPGQAERPPVY